MVSFSYNAKEDRSDRPSIADSQVKRARVLQSLLHVGNGKTPYAGIVSHSLRCPIFCTSGIVKGTLISHGEW